MFKMREYWFSNAQTRNHARNVKVGQNIIQETH